jgi:4-hydroxy-tetrahydrodipicolinate reductase
MEAELNEPIDLAKRYRVVQWATGNVGARALRRTIEHPDLELVGVYVHSADKVGRDAGDLAGIAPVGIAATNSVEDILALGADCVLYMPHVFDVSQLYRARIEEACRVGNSSVHATGASPGFISEAMPIVLASIQRRLDCLSIFEFADCSSRNSPEMLFGMMGFGARPEDGPNAGILQHMRMSFSGTIDLMTKAFGLPVDGIEVTGALGVARRDVHIAAGVVPSGTVAATRTTIAGIRSGKPVMQIIANWYVSSDVDTTDRQAWDFRKSGWRVLLEGDCPLDVGITFPVEPENYADMTPGLTAHRPVNVIPYVCEAPPGFQTIVDLPQVIARLG